MDANTVNLYNNEVFINNMDININCVENTAVNLMKVQGKSHLLPANRCGQFEMNGSTFIVSRGFTVVISSKNIDILYKKMVNVKIQYKKVEEKKTPTTVEEIIAARRKAKFERMRKFGLICFETPKEYNEYFNSMTEFKLATIIESTKKVTDEYNKLKTRLNMFHKPIIPISNPKLLDTPIKIDNLLKSNMRLFSENEKMTKQIEKWHQLAAQQFNNFITKEPIVVNDKIKKIKTRPSPIKPKKSSVVPSGFLSPKPISEELREFIFTTSGPLIKELSRLDATKHINTYIKQNNLTDKTNGRKINPDEKLSKLLGLKPTDELTYFNLQKYMGPHFIK